jgi:hypothetical protein
MQVSEQCVRLWKEGWFRPEDEPSGTSILRNPADPKHPAPVILAGKDVGEVDNDYFLTPVGIRDHEGALGSSFAIENRLLPQGKAELKAHLQARSSLPYSKRLADFHVLLYLAKQPNFESAGEGFSFFFHILLKFFFKLKERKKFSVPERPILSLWSRYCGNSRGSGQRRAALRRLQDHHRFIGGAVRN